MSKRRWKTAEELMAELNSDPEFLRKKAERDEKRQLKEEQYAEFARPILVRLRELGFEADSIEDLVKRHAPLPIAVTTILLKHVQPNLDDRHTESLVRALGAACDPFDGTPLTKCYDATSDESLRWAIANTIALTRPHSIDVWLAKAPVSLHATLKDLGYDPR